MKVEKLTTNEDIYVGKKTEMDSHADTIIAGTNTLLYSYTDRVCEVSPYYDDYEPMKDVPIVRAATGYRSYTRESYILILNEALWISNLDHTLLNPNQLRHHVVEVQYNPYAMMPITIKSHEDDFFACLVHKRSTLFIRT